MRRERGAIGKDPHRPATVNSRPSARSLHPRAASHVRGSTRMRVSSPAVATHPLLATSEAQPAVSWPVIDCDQPGVARLHECRARMARRRRLIRRPANFESGSAAVALAGPALRGIRARVGPSASSLAANDRPRAEVRSAESSLLQCRLGGYVNAAAALRASRREPEAANHAGHVFETPGFRDWGSMASAIAGASGSLTPAPETADSRPRGGLTSVDRGAKGAPIATEHHCRRGG